VTRVEDAVRGALTDGAAQAHESPDLFARVVQSIDEDRIRTEQRRHVALIAGSLLGAVVAVVVAVTDVREGEVLMDWWILELITTVFLAALALWLGPFIKRFGKAYAADVFRANPRTGKSFIVLTDFAYYLIFLSYIMFTTTFELPSDWDTVVNGAQLKSEVSRVAGIILIIGLLHGFNLLALPVIGRVFTLNRQLDEQVGPARPFPAPEASLPRPEGEAGA
jgi:type III secretory pathway component EscS